MGSMHPKCTPTPTAISTGTGLGSCLQTRASLEDIISNTGYRWVVERSSTLAQKILFYAGRGTGLAKRLPRSQKLLSATVYSPETTEWIKRQMLDQQEDCETGRPLTTLLHLIDNDYHIIDRRQIVKSKIGQLINVLRRVLAAQEVVCCWKRNFRSFEEDAWEVSKCLGLLKRLLRAHLQIHRCKSHCPDEDDICARERQIMDLWIETIHGLVYAQTRHNGSINRLAKKIKDFEWKLEICQIELEDLVARAGYRSALFQVDWKRHVPFYAIYDLVPLDDDSAGEQTVQVKVETRGYSLDEYLEPAPCHRLFSKD